MENKNTQKNQEIVSAVRTAIVSHFSGSKMQALADEVAPNLTFGINSAEILNFSPSVMFMDDDEEYQDIPCLDLNVANIWIEIGTSDNKVSYSGIFDDTVYFEHCIQARFIFTESDNLIVTFVVQFDENVRGSFEDGGFFLRTDLDNDNIPTAFSETVIMGYSKTDQYIQPIMIAAEAAIKKLLEALYKEKSAA